jgi:hypothetical protein
MLLHRLKIHRLSTSTRSVPTRKFNQQGEDVEMILVLLVHVVSFLLFATLCAQAPILDE